MTRKPKLRVLSDERLQKKLAAESDLEVFIETVLPKRLLANIHREAIRWMCDGRRYKLLLLPRDHAKSFIAACWGVWRLTKDPSLRILYISSTSNLAVKQLKYMKDILTSANYRLYWPDMVEKEEAKREKWTEREISIDHPKRKEESIREPSIFTAGMTTNIVGLHCDITVMDDVVTESNAYIETNRDKVKSQYSYLSSVEGTNAEELVVGTRYHPMDLYNDLIEMEITEHDEMGSVTGRSQLFDVFERQVETAGDGTGEFLWPRQQRSDGKWFGFDAKILGEKKEKYLNKTHFRAQYYNDPHDVGSSAISRNVFQYYEAGFLSCKNGRWYFKGNPLNVFAAVDFAFSLGRKGDSTSIAVIGVDGNQNYYILEIDRFKSEGRVSDYFQHILKLFEKWGFRKIRAEVTVAQVVIVKELKENYIRPLGLSLAVEEFRPTRWLGSKDERILAILEPKYANRQIWHYKGGNCQILEEELLFANPAHDDCKDALASAIDMAIAPMNLFRLQKDQSNPFQYHTRYGGVL